MLRLYIVSSVQLLSRVRLFATPWTSAHQAFLPITNSWSLLKLMSIELVMPSNHLILWAPFSSYLQSFPGSESFQMSQFFASTGQSIGVSASASVLPMNIQDWFPLGWTSWDHSFRMVSKVFSNTTVQKHQFFSAQLSSQYIPIIYYLVILLVMDKTRSWLFGGNLLFFSFLLLGHGQTLEKTHFVKWLPKMW